MAVALLLLGPLTASSADEVTATARRVRTLITGLEQASPAEREKRLRGIRDHLDGLLRSPRVTSSDLRVYASDVLPRLLSQLHHRPGTYDYVGQAIYRLTLLPGLSKYVTTSRFRLSEAEVASAVAAVRAGRTQVVGVLRWARVLNEEAVRELTGVLGRGGSMFATTAADVLAQRGPETRQHVLVVLEGKDEHARWMVAQVLGHYMLTEAEVRRALRLVSDAGGPLTQLAGLETLRGSVSARASWTNVLPTLLDEGDARVRSLAAELLGETGDRKHLPKLAALMWSPAGEGALKAIAKLGPDAALLPDLIKVVREHTSPRVREPALRALTKLGRAARSALPIVRQRAKSATDSYERAAARKALESLGR